jgi:ParB family chromosome partitioning protein
MEYVEMPLDLIIFGKAKLDQTENNICKRFKKRGDAIGTIVLLEPKAENKHRYKVVSGESAVRAAYFAGIDRVPCLIKEIYSEALITISNDSLSNVEDGIEQTTLEASFSLEKLMKSKGYSLRRAEKLGEGKRSTLNAALRLIRHLAPEVQNLVEQNRISKTSALEISYEKRPLQLLLAKKAIDEGWSKRDIIKARSTSTSDVKPLTKKLLREVEDFNRGLSEKSGLDLSITPKTNKTGLLKIAIYTKEEKQNVLDRLSSGFNFSFKLIAHGLNNIDMPEVSDGTKACTVEIQYKSLSHLDRVAELIS